MRSPRLLAGLAVLAAAALAAAGCGPKPRYRAEPIGGSRIGPLPPAVVAPPAGHVEEVASAWLGTPYRYGGRGERGIDCSSLAQHVLGDLGVTLPRTTSAQRREGRAVPLEELAPGDLVFFRLGSRSVNHVGIALGRDRFVHASSSRGVVVDRLMDEYFSRRVVEARRVLPDR